MLAKLQKDQPVENAEIITLAFHVDYWDYLGWKDKFSSAEFSRRQNIYTDILNLNSNYTPQMIVDGKAEFVGSNWERAVSEIGNAGNNSKAEVKITSKEKSLKIEIAGLSLKNNAEVLFVIAEDNLETDVRRGENSGRRLPHTSVVRDLKLLGNLKSARKSFEVETPFEVNSAWKQKDLKAIVFVQDEKTKEIYALGSTRVGE